MSKAIFLGSFNPPHKGHLNCIKSVCNSGIMDELNIDHIHIIPCYQNPNKSKQISFYDRWKMSLMLFSNSECRYNVCIDDIEDILKNKYTYELIDYFKSNKDDYIKDDFWWIITEETYEELLANKWKKSDKLLNENKFIIVYNIKHKDWLHRSYAKAIKEKRIVFVPLMENIIIHSTQLREKVKNNESIKEYTNDNIQLYINEEGLYV